MQDLVRGLLEVVDGITEVAALGVVNVDDILTGGDGQGLLIDAVEVIAVDVDLFVGARDHCFEGHIAHGLRFVQDLVRGLLEVVHGIAQIGFRLPLGRQGHIRGGHGESLFAGSFISVDFRGIRFGFGNSPAGELIAIARRHTVRHGNVSALRIVQLLRAITIVGPRGIVTNCIFNRVAVNGRRCGLVDLFLAQRHRCVALVGRDIFTGVTLAATGLHLDLDNQSFFGIAADALIVRREIIARDRHGLGLSIKIDGNFVGDLPLVVALLGVDLHVAAINTGKGEVVGQRVGNLGVDVQVFIDRLDDRIGDDLENTIQRRSVRRRQVVVRRIPIKILGDLPTTIADAKKGCLVGFQSNFCSALKIA